MSKPLTSTDIFTSGNADNWLAEGPKNFQILDEGRYRYVLEGPAVEVEVDRLRREHGELIGELTVRCELAGSRLAGAGTTADFNFSSLQARQTRAKYLRERARTKDEELDWNTILEEFTQRVHAAERAGQPAIVLRDVEPATHDDDFFVDGFPLLRRHPTIWFADGGTSKSFLALYIAGRLEQRGVRTLFADWEFDARDHRTRLGQLFGPDMPGVRYVRCDKPLVDECDRLQRIVRDDHIEYIIVDSIAVACGGAPESAELANRFMLALRRLRIGSLLIAHVNRSETGDQKPFGSAFWANNARSTWFIQRSDEASDENRVVATMFHRKINIGGKRAPIGYEIAFNGGHASVSLINAAEVPGAAERMSIAQRIRAAVRSGRRPIAEIAEETGIDAETIRTTVKRNTKSFTYLLDASGVYHIGNVDRRARAE